MLSIIAAFDENFGIGINNTLPWRLSEDLKRFKSITSGKVIIMGRKTFESLPSVLPNRKHIVVSSSRDYNVLHEDVRVVHNLDETLTNYSLSADEAFVIGGSSIFKAALPYCGKLYITKVYGKFKADTFFPEISFETYLEMERSKLLTDKKSGINYRFITYSTK